MGTVRQRPCLALQGRTHDKPLSLTRITTFPRSPLGRETTVAPCGPIARNRLVHRTMHRDAYDKQEKDRPEVRLQARMAMDTYFSTEAASRARLWERLVTVGRSSCGIRIDIAADRVAISGQRRSSQFA